MQTRFYDSAEPGPPHGWPDGGHTLTAQERAAWDDAIPFIRHTVRTLAGTGSEGVRSQVWGGLHFGERWWIYRGMPAKADSRSDRPGRTIAVIFCSEDIRGFDWACIRAVATELETLAHDSSRLALLLRPLDSTPKSTSLTDDLLKEAPTSLMEAIKSEISCLLNGLAEGSHEYFTITASGSVSNRGQENVAPKPPGPSQTLQSAAKTASPTAPITKSQPDKPPFMKLIISHVAALGIGLLLGFSLPDVFSPKPPAEETGKNGPKFRSVEEVIVHLRAAADYLVQSLEHREEPSGSVEPTTRPQHRSSTHQNPQN